MTAVQDGDRWTLVFTRELRHAPEQVWRSLTDPEELRQWAPYDVDRDLGTPGEATLVTAGADEESPSTVHRAEPPRLLEMTWGTDLLRWELERIPGGTRLTLRHTMDDRSWLPKVTAGWHICLDILALHRSGEGFGRLVGADAKEHWGPLNEAYSQKLGIENTGWPLGE